MLRKLVLSTEQMETLQDKYTLKYVYNTILFQGSSRWQYKQARRWFKVCFKYCSIKSFQYV